MIEYGFGAKILKHGFSDRVIFAKENGFDFIQLWYAEEGLEIFPDDPPFPLPFKLNPFPTIIHAVLKPDQISVKIAELAPILKELGHHELIVHPVLKGEPRTKETLELLSREIKLALKYLSPHSITMFLENNSPVNPLFHTPEEIKDILTRNPDLGFLMDVAHIKDLETLEKIVEIRMPQILHIADRNLDVLHEHLPLGEGKIDFKRIFSGPLLRFSGKIVLEITQSDAALKNSKAKLIEIIEESHSI